MRWLIFSIYCLVWIAPIYAQDNIIPAANRTYEVYLQQNIAGEVDLLLFIDVLDATAETVRVTGERYTALGDSVLFYNPETRTMMMVNPDGSIRPHPFILMNDAARRIDWIVSADQRNIAWTLTYGSGDSIRTETQVASITGVGQRMVLEDGARNDGVRALPVAFSVDNDALIMDAHPDLIGNFVPYTLYARLFRLDLEDGEIEVLPGENNPCFCGAGIRAGTLLRLAVTADLQGFNIRKINVNTGDVAIIDALRLPNYTQAGDVLISPDGTQAIYALSEVENFGTPQQSLRTVFVHVDLITNRQQQLSIPITDYITPVQWTDDNISVLLTSPDESGTWKIRLDDGDLVRVAESSYIGTIHQRIES